MRPTTYRTLTPSKFAKLQAEIKVYVKTYVNGKYVDLDESGSLQKTPSQTGLH
jgi:hypothetical protein